MMESRCVNEGDWLSRQAFDLGECLPPDSYYITIVFHKILLT